MVKERIKYVSLDTKLWEFMLRIGPSSCYFCNLRRLTNLHPMTLSRALKRLEKRGIIIREESGWKAV